MVRFLKKLFKPSKKPVPPGNPAPRIANIDAVRDGDPEGEDRSRKISADKVDGTDSTATPDTNDREGFRMADHDGRTEDQQLPAPNAESSLTPGHEDDNTSERSRL